MNADVCLCCKQQGVLVYGLYDLTDEEIKTVEEATAS